MEFIIYAAAIPFVVAGIAIVDAVTEPEEFIYRTLGNIPCPIIAQKAKEKRKVLLDKKAKKIHEEIL